MRSIVGPLARALAGATDAASAAEAVVAHLAADGRIAPSVYVPRAGRLRCIARGGTAPATDGLPLGAGPAGRALGGASEILEGAVQGGASAVAWLPLRAPEARATDAAGVTLGVLKAASREPLGDDDLARVQACAGALAARIGELGTAAHDLASARLLRHLSALAVLDDGNAIARALLGAARDLVALDSAVVVRARADGGHVPTCAAGPLAEALMVGSQAGYDHVAIWLDDGASCFAARGAVEALPGGAARIVAAKLAVAGDVLGMVVLADGESGPRVTTDDLERLEHLAAHAAARLRTAEQLQRLRERAETDPLTGLGHHASFHAALAASHRRPATALLVCDIDGFKRVNDTHGHAHGDRVLRALAHGMGAALRRGDRLYRIGGDEFAALLVVDAEDEALDAAQRLRDAVRDLRLGVTVSIGVAVPRDGEPDAALLERADRALYTAKGAGRDGIALAGEGQPGAAR